MGKFKAGDRVKILAGHPYEGDCAAGTVASALARRLGRRGKYLVDVDGYMHLSFKGRELELVVPLEWVPKVGDRVTVDGDKGLAAEAGAIAYVTSELDGGFVGVEWLRDGRDNWQRDGKYFPDTFAPAPLIIEAGNSYKTRDGRKVVGLRDRGEWFAGDIVGGDAGKVWFPNGRHGGPHVVNIPSDDIVAEWIEPEEMAPAAGAEPAASAAFAEAETPWTLNQAQPGDAVLCVEWRGTFFTEGQTYAVGSDGRIADNNGKSWSTGHLAGVWSLAAPAANEPATPPAKFKVGDRVECLVDCRGQYHVGGIYEVARVYVDVNDEARIGTAVDDLGSTTNGWVAKSFRLAPAPVAASEPATPPTNFIVARLTANGAPRPNARPRVHASQEAAEAEAQRLADRLGDEFAVYQRVAVRDVDAGPVPKGFDLAEAKAALTDPGAIWGAFSWSGTGQKAGFWHGQTSGLTPLGRAILAKWIAEANTAAKEAA